MVSVKLFDYIALPSNAILRLLLLRMQKT